MFKTALIIIAASAVAVLYMKPPLPAQHVNYVPAAGSPVMAVPAAPIVVQPVQPPPAQVAAAPPAAALLDRESLIGVWMYQRPSSASSDGLTIDHSGVLAFCPDGECRDGACLKVSATETGQPIAAVVANNTGTWSMATDGRRIGINLTESEITLSKGVSAEQAAELFGSYRGQHDFEIVQFSGNSMIINWRGGQFTLTKKELE